MLMVVLGRCKYAKCGADVTPGHVIRAFAIPGAPMHTALIYECGGCGNQEKIVAETVEWEQMLEEYVRMSEHKHIVSDLEIQVELGGIESPDDLVALWGAQRTPPLIEELMGKCKCDDCVRRIGG